MCIYIPSVMIMHELMTQVFLINCSASTSIFHNMISPDYTFSVFKHIQYKHIQSFWKHIQSFWKNKRNLEARQLNPQKSTAHKHWSPPHIFTPTSYINVIIIKFSFLLTIALTLVVCLFFTFVISKSVSFGKKNELTFERKCYLMQRSSCMNIPILFFYFSVFPFLKYA